MNLDQSTLMYIVIGLGAVFTLFIGVVAIGLVAWFFLRPAPRRPGAALASGKKFSKTQLYEDLEAVVEIFSRHREELRLDAVRGQMAEAAKKKA